MLVTRIMLPPVAPTSVAVRRYGPQSPSLVDELSKLRLSAQISPVECPDDDREQACQNQNADPADHATRLSPYPVIR
jgi:hypothetical protein